MSVFSEHGQIFNFKCKIKSISLAFLLSMSPSALAEPGQIQAAGGDVGELTLEELSIHASTISDILEIASERVETLSIAGAEAPDLLAAIRQELSLSRRWNGHLQTILTEVVEARRDLAERERSAAREIAEMAAMAEEARRELVALRKVLNHRPAEATEGIEGLSENMPPAAGDGETRNGVDQSGIEAVTEHLVGPMGDLDDARMRLRLMEDAQASAIRDVDAVRGKIIDALQTLATSNGNLSITGSRSETGLHSEDITAWAASVAAKLNRDSDQAVVTD